MSRWYAAVLFLAVWPTVATAQQRIAESFQITVIRDEATIRDFHGAIVAAGHDCPNIKLAFTEYVKASGKLSMVYCGIGRANNIAQFPALLYRIFDDGGPLIVIPW